MIKSLLHSANDYADRQAPLVDGVAGAVELSGTMISRNIRMANGEAKAVSYSSLYHRARGIYSRGRRTRSKAVNIL